ncbi:HEAVY METAL ASSOCIATED PROTEIN 22 [Hibiscus trionum]|uniref:HEAVY METAL ASSOCIATED PROTEIN 22 n=1 Tax=Hibiscus trionum TaxID=183268 RepID=A0A9W7HU70_HIBTR|nr:HEAVY METAL ASSOCIATED PROTEIN 22 [Hibiscus trionum]
MGNAKEIVLKVHMHCEGCASEVSNCLKGFEGIEEVETDIGGDRVKVKGQKADPLKVLERIKMKYSKNAELISPKPKPIAVATVQKESKKKQEIPIEVVSLKMYIHCEGCANDIKTSIEKMKGILNVEADMKNSTVTITGSFDRSNIAETIRRRLKKYVEMETMKPKHNENGKENGNDKKKGEDRKINVVLNYPPQYSSQNICPNHIFSDENIYSCSLM